MRSRRSLAKLRKRTFQRIDQELQRPPKEIDFKFAKETLNRLETLNVLENLAKTYDLQIKGEKYDVEVSPDEPLYWGEVPDSSDKALTTAGRAAFRKLIDEEKNRRFEIRVWCPRFALLLG
ncbi:MAG: hypothetical protein ACLPPV_13070 [Candidatus Korobacteraceae bacterium]|jgi:hypothetical protein